MNLKVLLLVAFACYALTTTATQPSKKHGHVISKKEPTPVDFTLTDTSGKPVSIHDFAGKFVVISMGASWCGPCLTEVEPTKQMQKYISKNKLDKDVVWVFVNFDKDSAEWVKSRHKENLNGVHLWGRPNKENLKKQFAFNSLPYYIWINKDGTLAKKDGPRPSEPAAKHHLKSFLKHADDKRVSFLGIL